VTQEWKLIRIEARGVLIDCSVGATERWDQTLRYIWTDGARHTGFYL
jgi:hypothetical protein